MLGTKEALMLVSRPTTERYSLQISTKKSRQHFESGMQLGHHPDLKMLQLQGKWSSLPYDSVNQLEMSSISLRLNVCRTHQNLAI